MFVYGGYDSANSISEGNILWCINPLDLTPRWERIEINDPACILPRKVLIIKVAGAIYRHNMVAVGKDKLLVVGG